MYSGNNVLVCMLAKKHTIQKNSWCGWCGWFGWFGWFGLVGSVIPSIRRIGLQHAAQI
jgi:hypothetical protein